MACVSYSILKIMRLGALISLLLPSTAVAGICNDKVPDCANWARAGECTKNPSAMALQCPLSCSVCQFECKDTDESCVAWSQSGQCEVGAGLER